MESKKQRLNGCRTVVHVLVIYLPNYVRVLYCIWLTQEEIKIKNLQYNFHIYYFHIIVKLS